MQFSSAILHAGSPLKIFAIILGGHLNGNADFLCAVACSVLPFGVAFPIYAGWGLAQGTILNYFILGMPGNAAFLFSGVIFALLAIAQLAYSDGYDTRNTTKTITSSHTQPSQIYDAEIQSEWHNVLHQGKEAESFQSEPSVNHDTTELLTPPTVDNRRYIYLCLFAGFLNGLWSPLSSLGTSGSGGIINPYAGVFLFECGQLSSLFLSLNYYGGGKVFALSHVKVLLSLPWKDIVFGMLSGFSVGMGFTFYFVASSVILTESNIRSHSITLGNFPGHILFYRCLLSNIYHLTWSYFRKATCWGKLRQISPLVRVSGVLCNCNSFNCFIEEIAYLLVLSEILKHDRTAREIPKNNMVRFYFL